jgi:hypothetical protein
LYYKYELPYDESVAANCLDQFEKADLAVGAEAKITLKPDTAIKAKRLLARVFANFDSRKIVPKHGPGAVSGKEKRTQKYAWSSIPSRTSAIYPIDAYYYASLGHVADCVRELNLLPDNELSARVLLVPKDSRGPRIISCEPKEFQWLQQGLMSAIVDLVESSPLTRREVHFTDQQPNRDAAQAASLSGDYVTLDLKEASDRVSLQLVDLLWPDNLKDCLYATRSLSTLLPNGKLITLNKFAPMGSALCFPVMAMTIWSLLIAGGCGAENRKVLVYGDDVIVHKDCSSEAINILESCLLLVNKDKSCTRGLFRESCGMDAYKGIDVTPVRFRTVWSSRPAASPYASWVAYCNLLFTSGYIETAHYIAALLIRIYGSIPDSMIPIQMGYPGFIFDMSWNGNLRPKRRVNSNLQRLEHYVYTLESVRVFEEMPGWSKLLRYFTESGAAKQNLLQANSLRWSKRDPNIYIDEGSEFQASQYTLRKRSKLRKRWR